MPAVAAVAVEPGPVAPATEDGEHKKKRKKDKADKDGKNANHAGVTTSAGRIQIKGRVLALAELRNQERIVIDGASVNLEPVNSLDLSLTSARIGIEYEAPMRWISAVAELELEGKPSLKDGYVQARGKHFFARAGQFKLPVSALETESPWTLPLVRRGLMHDLLTDWLDVGGRHPGLMVGWRGRGGLQPRFMVGAFQGAVLGSALASGDRDTDPLLEKSMDAQSYVARAQFEPGGIQLGAWYEHRLGSAALNEFKHYFTVGVDATVDHVLPTGGVRVWLEGTTGSSWYEQINKPADDDDALFVMGRALGGYRFGGTVDDAPYVEPFGFFGVFEPDTDVVSDLAFEGAVGVAGGFWRRARVTLEGHIVRAQRNFPAGATGFLGGEELDRMSLLLQAGVAW